VSVEAIAELAEVSPATVYNLVGRRDQLYAALLGDLDLFWIEGTTRRWDGYTYFQRQPDRILEWFARFMN
jgi:AcrR family transcriptional regulator